MAEELKLISADVADIPGTIAGVRDNFRTFKTLDVSFRRRQLENLRKLVTENKQKIFDALYTDLHKSEVEANIMEVQQVLNDFVTVLDNLDEWTAPQPYPKDLLNKFNSLYTQAEPYGVVLIIAPWNYPFSLIMQPLMGAIAAGNCCVIKPGEASVATSNLVTELIPKYLDNDCYVVVPGAVEVGKALLEERFDHIFYTGSTNVGRIVMKSAAENLTPVTLELGGKSPVIVAPDANIDVAARRIVWGKCLNSGQTCIAPDYVLFPKDKEVKLVEACKKAVTEFYGEDPQQAKDYGRIINAAQFKRLVGLIEGTQGQVVFGGKSDEATRYISPTLVTGVTPDDPLMKSELFGPILPFIAVDSVDEAVSFVNSREKPLAFYVFTESTATFQDINKKTSAGGVVQNDTLMHSGVESFPFGGVGHSGMGAYHGIESFKAFSHYKPTLCTGTGLESLNKLRYPPFKKKQLKRLQWLLSRRPRSRFPWKLLTIFLLIALVAVLVQTYSLPDWLYQFTGR